MGNPGDQNLHPPADDRPSRWAPTAWAAVAVAAALLVQTLLHERTRGVAPLATFYAAVAFAALKGGRTGGWVTIASGLLLSWYFLMEPRYSLQWVDDADAVRMLLFAVNGAIIAEICARYRDALERARGLEAEALRAGKLLEAIGTASPDLIYAKDRQFRTIYANPATLEVLGVPRDEVLGRATSEYASEEGEGEAHASNDARVMESGRVEISDEVFTSPDGTRRIFRSSKAPLRDEQGEIIGIAGVSIDMTEQRETETQLRLSESRLRLALDAGRMAVWDLDHTTDTLTGSPELNKLLGFSEDHALNVEDIRARYAPGEREKLLGAVAAALERGDRHAEGEFRYLHPDGSVRWFVISAELVVGESGQLQRTTGVLLEVTGLKATEASLAEREIELKAALEAGRLAIVDYDHKTHRFRHSPGLNELYGYPADKELTIADVRARYHPESAHFVYEQRDRDQAAADQNAFEWTIRLQMPGGQERWVYGVGEYLRDDSGAISRSRGVVMDVTERVQSDRHQKLLIAELNHRVKNTLAIVQGLAHQSFRSLDVPPQARRAFEGRLEALATAHNLLTKEKWEGADLRELIDTALRPHVGPARGVQLEGPAVRLDPKLAVTLSMAVHELATNAVKYGALSAEGGQLIVRWSLEGDAEPRLKISWQERGGPRVEEPQGRGFGTRMIEHALARDLEGTVVLHFEPEGLRCVVDAPYRIRPSLSGELEGAAA